MKYEIYLSIARLGQPYRSPVVAECDDLKAARAIIDALRHVYTSPAFHREKPQVAAAPRPVTKYRRNMRRKRESMSTL